MATSESAARPETPTAPKGPSKPAQTAVQAPPPRLPHEPGNYWLSSLELRRGMEVEVLGMRHVPGEVLREFLRMHRAWEARRLPAAPLATSALDIALEADGSVTIPGDLHAAGA